MEDRGCGDVVRGNGKKGLLSGCRLRKDSMRKQDSSLRLVRNNIIDSGERISGIYYCSLIGVTF